MSSRMRNVTVDCVDARRLAAFWADVLGWHLFTDDDPEVLVTPAFPSGGDGPSMLFIPVSEPRTTKKPAAP